MARDGSFSSAVAAHESGLLLQELEIDAGNQRSLPVVMEIKCQGDGSEVAKWDKRPHQISGVHRTDTYCSASCSFVFSILLPQPPTTIRYARDDIPATASRQIKARCFSCSVCAKKSAV
jgi:hypothetical protein